MLHFENSHAQMIFSASGDGVAMILLQPILQITGTIPKPSEEPSLANPSIAFRDEVNRSHDLSSLEEQVAEEGAAGLLGLHHRHLLGAPGGGVVQQVLHRAAAPGAGRGDRVKRRLADAVAGLALHGPLG